jgi:hypothetical protein
MDNDLRDLLTFARYEARKRVKEHWRSQGIKLSEWSMRDLRIASEQYLADHWNELRPKAEEILRWSKAQDEKRRAKIRNCRQKQKPSNHSTIPVQISGAK